MIGPDSSIAEAGNGDHDIAYLLDTFGRTAGAGGANYDLAAVLLTDGNAGALHTDYLYDVLCALGHESGTSPTSVLTLLTEWSSLF